MNSRQLLAPDLVLRRERLQAVMQQKNMEACILTTGVNIFYLSGEIYTGYLYLPCEGEPIHFVKRPVDLSLPNVIAVRKPFRVGPRCYHLTGKNDTILL